MEDYMTDEQLQRIHDIEYSCDSRAELAERIVMLEEGYGSMSREHSQTIVELSDAIYESERLKAENAKLRACLGDGCADCAVGMGKYADSICDQIKAENEKLIIKLNAEHIARQNAEVDNAKLRELVCRYVEYTSQDRCEGCVVKSRCNDGEVDECWQLTEIRGMACELGVEVYG